MKRIDELLEKYFAGITSLQEEMELKNYFGGNEIAPEHKKYIPLFQAFEKEKEIIMPKQEAKIKRKTSLRRQIIYFSSGIAAACLISVLVFRYQAPSENYMIVHGKRINDAEKAQEFANTKIEKSLNVIHKSLASYKDNKEIREKLQEIENQIKINE